MRSLAWDIKGEKVVVYVDHHCAIYRGCDLALRLGLRASSRLYGRTRKRSSWGFMRNYWHRISSELQRERYARSYTASGKDVASTDCPNLGEN